MNGFYKTTTYRLVTFMPFWLRRICAIFMTDFHRTISNFPHMMRAVRKMLVGLLNTVISHCCDIPPSAVLCKRKTCTAEKPKQCEGARVWWESLSPTDTLPLKLPRCFIISSASTASTPHLASCKPPGSTVHGNCVILLVEFVNK